MNRVWKLVRVGVETLREVARARRQRKARRPEHLADRMDQAYRSQWP